MKISVNEALLRLHHEYGIVQLAQQSKPLKGSLLEIMPACGMHQVHGRIPVILVCQRFSLQNRLLFISNDEGMRGY